MQAQTTPFSFPLIADELHDVQQQIFSQAQQFDPALQPYIAHACKPQGKHLRASLALLTAGATGTIRPDHIRLALIVELIHLATLIHDDIIDNAQIRRNLPTANAQWGNALSVLLGDCLFAHALTLSAEFSPTEIPRKIAGAARTVCAGEMLQTRRRFDLSLSRSDYLRIIEMKTAALFSLSTEASALLNQAEPVIQQSWVAIGLNFGTAYQIYDDCIDLLGSEKDYGKTLGTDWMKGKLTLPLIYILEEATTEQKKQLQHLLEVHDHTTLQDLNSWPVFTKAIHQALQHAHLLIEQTSQQLHALPANDYTQNFQQLINELDQRLRLVVTVEG